MNARRRATSRVSRLARALPTTTIVGGVERPIEPTGKADALGNPIFRVRRGTPAEAQAMTPFGLLLFAAAIAAQRGAAPRGNGPNRGDSPMSGTPDREARKWS